MVEFRVVVSDPKEGKSWQVQVSGQHANVLVRKRMGDDIDGMFVGLPGYKLKITGGTDKDGFSMRRDLPTSGRKQTLTAASVGFHPKDRGVRRRLSFRGNEIGLETAQINTVVVTRGPKPVAELLPKKEEKK